MSGILDANSLYGHSKMQPLSFETFCWVDPEEINLDSYLEDGAKVCFLKVDHDYHDELHDFHKDYTLAAEKTKLTKMMSKYHLKIIENNEFLLGKSRKLIPSLRNKKNAVSIMKI